MPREGIDLCVNTFTLVGMYAEKKQGKRAGRAPRDAERTRNQLLQAAFREVYEAGYEGADVDTVVDRAGVTKGALYHHFEGKGALGIAVIDEVIGGMGEAKWIGPLRECANPIDTLIRIIQGTSLKQSDVNGGCALNNLAQEMSQRDEAFRHRLAKLFERWRDAIAAALRDGQRGGLVKKNVKPEDAALFVVAAYEGYMSLAKNAQDRRVLQAGIRWLSAYLESLRPHD